MNRTGAGIAEPFRIGPSDVHVWWMRVDAPGGAPGTFHDVLSAAERARAAQFRFERDRARFIASRGALRLLLAQYQAVAPETLEIAYGPYGKPYIDGGREPVGFNLSHAGDLVICAVARDRAVGIDTEQVRPIDDLGSVAARVLSRQERRRMPASDGLEASRIFLQAWTFKEAYLKARGDGISDALTLIESPGPDEDAGILHEPAGQRSWSWRRLGVLPDYVGALLVSGSCDRVVVRPWPAPIGLTS